MEIERVYIGERRTRIAWEREDECKERMGERGQGESGWAIVDGRVDVREWMRGEDGKNECARMNGRGIVEGKSG